jgi:hypothetical protein
MLRPLPPFRMRPLRKQQTPKIIGLGLEKLDTPISVKPARRPVKVQRLAPAGRLKVLGRTSEARA